MFKVPAGSVEEYFRFDPAREDDLRTLDELIRGAAPGLLRWFVPGTPDGQPGMTMTMIGYGKLQYYVKRSPVPVTWPVLGLALQKNYISLYNSAYADGPPFTCAYAGRLGRARVSKKGVVTFGAVQDMNLQALTEMITAIEARHCLAKVTRLTGYQSPNTPSERP
jgi:hypothetical protein